MIFDPSSAAHLKPWLVRTLEPICDAEPGALADYILALLKHNVPESEMRKELAVQLDEFLESAECSSFIDTLFTVLRTKSYLPYSAASPSSPPFNTKPLDTGIPIPLDGLLSPSLPAPPDRKRSIDNDERDGRPPAKGPRLSAEGQFSRYTNGQGGRPEARSTGGWGGRIERPSGNGYRDGVDVYGGGMGMPGLNGPMGQMNRRPQVYQPPDQKRGICRDYHNSGYCARGAMCKYSHGEDAVVPGQLYPMNGPVMSGPGMAFMSMFPGAGVPFGIGGGAGVAYDPHEARMDMRPTGGRPQQRAPLLPRIKHEDGSQVVHNAHTSGELPVIQDLTPVVPPDTTKPRPDVQSQPQPQPQPQLQQSHLDVQQPPQDAQVGHSEGTQQNEYEALQHRMANELPYLPMNMPMEIDMVAQTEMGPPTHDRSSGFRSGVRSSVRGRGGTFGGESHNFRPERRNDRTLVVEKIPEEKLTLEHVNGWFKRFGTVTNVAIDSANAKALISFANHDEAYAAWKSEDAVFNNRFVKLFWHRPMEGHGQAGARMLAASAPAVANMSIKEVSVRPAIALSGSPTAGRKLLTPKTSALAAKQQLLEQQINEQKSLIASLATASSDEKKEIMARLRKLGEEMKPTSSAATPVPSVAIIPVSSSATSGERERKERERLDKELEVHNATLAVEGEEESKDDLKVKLARLKAEAASLGIAEAQAEPSYSGTYRPYRGRARGVRGYHRGAMRGGPPRASMKLDNRPKKLLVKGVRDDDGRQALRDWFETTGLVDPLESSPSGDIIVTFKSRAAAEQGLSKGQIIPTVGPVQLTWFTGKHATMPISKTASPDTVPSSAVDIPADEPARARSPEQTHAHSPRIQEEEVVASGWGEDGDGEDGMGML